MDDENLEPRNLHSNMLVQERLGRFTTMNVSRVSPKPIIARVVQTWAVPPGMKVALVEDVEHNVWVVESCPVGTHFWTLAQASELPQASRVGQALRTAVTAGRAHIQARASNALQAPSVSLMPEREIAPLLPTPETRLPARVRENSVRSLRRSTRRDKVAVCA